MEKEKKKRVNMSEVGFEPTSFHEDQNLSLTP